MLGWEMSPDQLGASRPALACSIKNLYFVGHWTQPGSTSLRVLVSGFHTAQAVLASSGSPPIRIDHPDLPPL